MKTIVIFAIKGGVGKSTVTAGLGTALRDNGFRIGFADFDYYGSNLPTALGIPEPFPYVELDTAREKMLAVKINGYEIFSLSFRFGKAALIWEGGEQKVTVFGQEFILHGTGTYELVKQMISNVEFSQCDYLLLDMPPSSGDITLSLFENISELWGIILVCQPTNLAVQDIERTLNMMEVKRLPLLGMVGNMSYAIAPKSKEEFFPFLDAGVDLEGFCNQRGIPYLASIPLTPEKELIDSKFQRMAEKVIAAAPVRIWQKSFKQRVEEATVKGIVKGLFRG
ncbi:Iron-sulfur cluster carrier protein [subsurface metagenome]